MLKSINKVIAMLLCLILICWNILIIIPNNNKSTNISYKCVSIANADDEIDYKNINTKEINVTTRSIESRKELLKYNVYKFIINDKDILYFDNKEDAYSKSKYLFNKTDNVNVNILEIVQNDKSNISTADDIESIINKYINKYKKVTTCFPTKSHIVSSTYGKRSSRGDFHSGIDLAGNYGDNIYAYKSGTVVKVQYSNSSYGNMVLIKHDNGIQTRYAHMSSIKVKNGQSINCGQTIGYMGSTGNSTGNHLHFEIIINGNTVNPYNYIF